MANIDLERKKGGGAGWLWGILGLLAVLLIVWWVWPDDEPELADATVTPVTETVTPDLPEPVATTPAMTIGDMLGNPSAYIGQSMPQAEVRVAEVPTNRGFWIEDGGQRMFALIIDEPQEEPKDINPGATLRIDQATLRDQTYLPQLAGDELDADTRRIVEEQPAFLVVNESQIQILSPGNPQ